MIVSAGSDGTRIVGGTMNTARRIYVGRPPLYVLLIAVLVAMLIFLGSLVLIYSVDEYVSPAWDEQSVPAPRTY